MLKLWIPLTLLFLFVPAGRAAERAWYGFHIKVETMGFPLNPIVRSVVIDKVARNSPASEQNIQVGDEIVEAEGRTVPGGRALQLRPVLLKSIGEMLHLRLKRSTGEIYAAVMTGVRKPPPKNPSAQP